VTLGRKQQSKPSYDVPRPTELAMLLAKFESLLGAAGTVTKERRSFDRTDEREQ